jgi:glutathione S-transferase
MSQVIIHGMPQSTYVRTARMVCEEKAIAYELDPARPGDMKDRGLHPFGRIPAMTHGEVRLFETAAIACYLDRAFDGSALQPEDPVALSEMVQWISAINDTVYDAMVRRIVLQYIFPRGADGEPDRAVIDPAVAQARDQLATLDLAYGSGTYLVGSGLTIADLFLAPILFYLEQMPEGPEFFAAAPNVKRAFSVLCDRPSFSATLPPPPPGEASAA